MLIDDEDFLKQVQKDMILDPLDLEKEQVNVSGAREKYTKLFAKCKRKFVNVERALQEKYAERYVFFNEKYEIQLKPTEVDHYIKNDPSYKLIDKEHRELKVDFEYLKDCLANINSKGWDIKNLIEYRRQLYNLGINPDYH